MALFSRRKNESSDQTPDAVEPVDESSTVASPSSDPAPVDDSAVPHVNISVSAFGGLGQTPRTPEPPAPAPVSFDPATFNSAVQNDASVGEVPLPYAPDVPPTEWTTAASLRDNAVLRDALARLPESDPETMQLLGVVRQVLQGHLFLRVKGDAREQAEAGEELQLSILRDGDRTFMLAFSSGRALQAAVVADQDTDTSSFGQPAVLVLRHVLDAGFAGLIIDNASAPARIVVPRDLIERVMGECDPEFRLKTVVAADRDENTVARAVDTMQTASMWVAVGVAGEQDGEPVRGVAEARTADGRRYLQVFTHPLEVVALGRDEQAAPFDAEKLRAVMRDHSGLAGVLIDPAGPNLRIEIADLEPLLAVTDDESDDDAAVADDAATNEG